MHTNNVDRPNTPLICFVNLSVSSDESVESGYQAEQECVATQSENDTSSNSEWEKYLYSPRYRANADILFAAAETAAMERNNGPGPSADDPDASTASDRDSLLHGQESNDTVTYDTNELSCRDSDATSSGTAGENDSNNVQQ